MEQQGAQIYVEGPIEFTELKDDKYGKHIYLFGDMHVHKKICANKYIKPIHIVDFIKRTINDNYDKVIDFFLEVDFGVEGLEEIAERDRSQFGRYKGVEMSPSSSYLSDLRRALYDCFQYDKRLCPDKRTRYQWSDSRFRGIFRDWLDYVQLLLSPATLMAKTLGRTNELLDVGKNLIDITPDLQELYRIAKVDKQLANIPHPEIKDLIHQHFDRSIKDEILNARAYFDELSNTSTIDEIVLAAQFMISAISNLMDAYVMARIFRTFTNPEKGRRTGPTPSNIIIYAGNAHISNMLFFLDKIPSMKLISHSKSDTEGKDFQCLKLAAKVPFFGGAKIQSRDSQLITALKMNDATMFAELVIKGTKYEAMFARGGYTLFAPSDAAFLEVVLPGLGFNTLEEFTKNSRFDFILRTHILDRALDIQQLAAQKFVKALSKVELDFEDGMIQSIPILNSFTSNKNIVHIIDGILMSEADFEYFTK